MKDESLGAEEIVRRVLDAERSIESFQVEEARVDEKGGERKEAHALRIRVGEDVYERLGGEEPPWDEQLTYRGVEYYRTAAWKTSDEFTASRVRAGGHLYAEMGRVETGRAKDSAVAEHVLVEGETTNWDEALVSKTYALDFNRFLDAEVLDEQRVDGQRVIGLSVSLTMPLRNPLDDLEGKMFPAGMADPNGVLDKLRGEMAKLPDTVSHRQVVWIGVDDSRVYCVETTVVEYREEVEVGRHAIRQTYSLFNQASLPGPLP